MTIKNLIAEITTELKSYDEAGLIDNISLKRWIRNELKRFGANIMQKNERVLDVFNGKTTLPEDFYSLVMAVKCEPMDIRVDKECKDLVQSSRMYKDIVGIKKEWDNHSNIHRFNDIECRTEVVYLRDCGCNAEVDYGRFQVLKLVKGFNKEYCAKNCLNVSVKEAPYTINIIRDTVNLNFKEGKIYIHYYGLPTDEDGDIYIPDDRNIEEYLIAYCRRKILETLLYNNDDPNVVNKIQLSRGEERELFQLAMTSSKFKGLGNTWDNRIKAANRAETTKYERLFRTR